MHSNPKQHHFARQAAANHAKSQNADLHQRVEDFERKGMAAQRKQRRKQL